MDASPAHDLIDEFDGFDYDAVRDDVEAVAEQAALHRPPCTLRGEAERRAIAIFEGDFQMLQAFDRLERHYQEQDANLHPTFTGTVVDDAELKFVVALDAAHNVDDDEWDDDESPPDGNTAEAASLARFIDKLDRKWWPEVRRLGLTPSLRRRAKILIAGPKHIGRVKSDCLPAHRPPQRLTRGPRARAHRARRRVTRSSARSGDGGSDSDGPGEAGPGHHRPDEVLA